MKKELIGRHFDSDDDVTDAVDHLTEAKEDNSYKEGICLLRSWTKCLNEGETILENNYARLSKTDSVYLRP